MWTKSTLTFRENPFAAERVKQQIRSDIEKLGELPFIGQPIDIPELRTRKVKRYPYRIFYAVRGDEVLILHIRHGARLMPWEDET